MNIHEGNSSDVQNPSSGFTNEPAHEMLVLITLSSTENSGETAQKVQTRQCFHCSRAQKYE